MKAQLAVLFSVLLIASAARERVLYEAFSGLDCQDADLGSITVRFEDDTEPRYDCTNYDTTSYRSTANAPIPDPIDDWAYVAVQFSTCPVTDAMEYSLYAGKSSADCWTYHNFTVFVNGVNQALSINLFTNECNEVYHLEDYDKERCWQRATNRAHSAAVGKIPIEFAPVAAPVAASTPNNPGSPTNSNSPSSKSSNAVSAITAGLVSLSGLLALYL